MMTDAADDAREREEEWEYLKALHKQKQCDWDCPYCEMEDE